MKVRCNIWLIPKAVMGFLLLLVLYVVVEWGYVGARNYYGYCTDLGANYGERLSIEDRLNLAIEHYLRNQKALDYKEIRRKMGAGFSEETKLIPYASKDEFLEINAECCELTKGLSDGDWLGFWERADGLGDGMFVFSHKVRYTSEVRSDETIMSEKSYYMVDNCGNAKFKFYH